MKRISILSVSSLVLLVSCSSSASTSMAPGNTSSVASSSSSSVFTGTINLYTRDTSSGTGLGLAIVKHVCSKYNYKISLESQLKVGITIKITF